MVIRDFSWSLNGLNSATLPIEIVTHDATFVVVPVLAPRLRLDFFWGKTGHKQGTIGAWVAPGARPAVPVARAAHVPDSRDKRG